MAEGPAIQYTGMPASHLGAALPQPRNAFRMSHNDSRDTLWTASNNANRSAHRLSSMATTAAVPSHRVLGDVVAHPSTRLGALAVDAGLVVAGTALVAVLAQVAIPLWPVPITGQTLGVLLVGASLGAMRGTISLALYAVLGLIGLPVFAPQTDGSHLTGAAAFASPSFGYIIGFVLSAAVVGYLASRRWDRRMPMAVVAFVIGSLAIYAVGLPWLAVALSHLGVPQNQLLSTTLSNGLYPFLIGDAIKAVIAGALLPVAWRGVHAADARKRR
jgi:biotin transport system substrate-specific component